MWPLTNFEVVVLRNQHNGNKAEGGNVCVKKFLGLPSDRIFKAIQWVAPFPELRLIAKVNPAKRCTVNMLKQYIDRAKEVVGERTPDEEK